MNRWRQVLRMGSWCAFLGLLGKVWGGLGVVDTLDGHRYEGQIRLDSNYVAVVDTSAALVWRVGLTNLRSLWFRSRSQLPDETTVLRPTMRLEAWNLANVGNGAQGGVSYLHDYHLRLAATGTNILGRRDAFHFRHTRLAGDGDLAARLRRFEPATGQARAGLMLRESLEPEARNLFLGMTARGAVVQWRPAPGEETVVEHLGVTGPWFRLKRSGHHVLAYTSSTGRHWHLVRRVDLDLAFGLHTGLVVAGAEDTDGRGSRLTPRASQAVFDSIQHGPTLRFHAHAPKVSLKSGSMATGDIEFADHRSLRFLGTGRDEGVPVREVTRIDFYWVPGRFHHWLDGDQPGVLLSSGEFVEGRFRGVEDGMCLISSVLFGLKRFEIEGQVLSVILGRAPLASGSYEVTTWSGSSWFGTLESMDEEGLVLRESSMGEVTIPYYQLKQMSRRGSG